LMLCNAVPPFILWSRTVRLNPYLFWIISIIVNIGMWLERFIIIVTSLHRSFITAEWEMFHPSIIDITTYVGSIGLFMFLMLLFLRLLPAISIFEMRELLDQTKGEDKH
jgi:hypothetical protein